MFGNPSVAVRLITPRLHLRTRSSWGAMPSGTDGWWRVPWPQPRLWSRSGALCTLAAQGRVTKPEAADLSRLKPPPSLI